MENILCLMIVLGILGVMCISGVLFIYAVVEIFVQISDYELGKHWSSMTGGDVVGTEYDNTIARIRRGRK